MSLFSKLKIKNMLGLTGLAWLSVVAVVAINQRKLVFNPIAVPESDGTKSGMHKVRKIVLHAADGTRLAGWLLTPKTEGPHPAVIYFGGRSEEISWIARDAERMFPQMAVIAMNYRGYGQSMGQPGEAVVIDDAASIYDWLSEYKDIDSTRIGVIGRSLGSGVAIQLAIARAVKALVLITPYDSILAIAKKRFKAIPVGLLLRHRFESINFVKNLNVPTFILRSETDNIVPHSHTDVLASKVVNLVSDETIAYSNHCDIPYLEATQHRVSAILNQHLLN